MTYSFRYIKSDVIQKPKVHQVSHYRKRRTEPQPQIIPIENLVKFGRAIFDTQADRQAGR